MLQAYLNSLVLALLRPKDIYSGMFTQEQPKDTSRF